MNDKEFEKNRYGHFILHNGHQDFPSILSSVVANGNLPQHDQNLHESLFHYDIEHDFEVPMME